jgi:DNA-binding NtrC family response regulator
MVKTPTVLVVLDEHQDLDVYGTYLSNRGYQTMLCGSPAEGIKFLESQSVSLVIVSQGSPAFEGRQVLEWSLRLHPEIPVVVIARVVNMDCYLEAMDLGAVDYLERPDPKALARVVDVQVLHCACA